jgi:hypothetical protein
MNLSAIQADINFLCGSTSGTYAPADKIRNINVCYQDVARLVWESDGGWSYDDSNNTNAPVAYTTLGNLSGSYTIPTTAIRIEGVEVKDGDSNWMKLNPLIAGDLPISREEYLTGGGLPIYYELEGNEIRLYPAPMSGYTTLASGMMVRLSRAVNEFSTATGAGSALPGFASPFHRILSYAAAIDFVQDPNQRQFFALQKQRLEQGLVRFYSKRATEFKSTLKPSTRRRWKSYI